MLLLLFELEVTPHTRHVPHVLSCKRRTFCLVGNLQTGAAPDGAHLAICYLDKTLVSKEPFSSYLVRKVSPQMVPI